MVQGGVLAEEEAGDTVVKYRWGESRWNWASDSGHDSPPNTVLGLLGLGSKVISPCRRILVSDSVSGTWSLRSAAGTSTRCTPSAGWMGDTDGTSSLPPHPASPPPRPHSLSHGWLTLTQMFWIQCVNGHSFVDSYSFWLDGVKGRGSCMNKTTDRQSVIF